MTAQIVGKVIDASTGETVPFAGVVYRGHHIQSGADWAGNFKIERHNGWILAFSAVGYKSTHVRIETDTPLPLIVKLQSDTKQIDEVLVTSKKGKYSRKNNPAVELMKRVINAKKQNKLETNPFYQYYKYQKITLAKNNVTAEELQKMREKGNKDWLVDQVEFCQMNNHLILPVQVDETVTQHVYRKTPESSKDFILGESSTGISHLLETTGNIVSATVKDIFTDVDIYDEQVRLLQHPFTSPISKDAIDFYRFYIIDTLMIGADRCIELSFVPNNQQDFGFRGSIFVLDDSTYHVRKVDLTIPKKSDVNFVENMQINQEYVRLPDGQWVLDTDNMLVEMKINRLIKDGVIIRKTKYTDYQFTDIPKNKFRGKASVYTDADSKNRGKSFWQKFRTVELTKSESSMNNFIKGVSNIKGFKYILFGLKAFMENYVELSVNDSVRSKFDIGPVNTIINKNIVDGYRFRASGRSTTAFNPRLFWEGYVAYGSSSRRPYYGCTFTYSFNRKENMPWEFPIRQIMVSSESDIMSPSDKFLSTNKDNLFTAFHVKKIDKMYFYNRQQVEFKYETNYGLATTLGVKAEGVKGAAAMEFLNMDGTPFGKEVRTTEFHLGFRYAPDETFVNTKQRRYSINRNGPIFSLDHTIAIDGFLGGKYKTNFTEASVFKRFWLKSWGKFDLYLAAGAQWEKVPFPLLIMPKTNLSFISQHGTYTFQLMNNLEFLNDRYAMFYCAWDINGKIFNRIPLLKELKLREFVCVRGMWGKLTDKNNPFLAQNANDKTLMLFPEGCNLMDNRCYWECVVGIHNIFKILEIDYVHRMAYREKDTAIKRGVRFSLNFTF